MKTSVIFFLATILAHSAQETRIAANARIWLQVPPGVQPLDIACPEGTVGKGGWLPTPDEQNRLTDIYVPITTEDWKEASINFTPTSDATVTFSLLGPWNEDEIREEVLYDHLSATGTTIQNRSFEQKKDSSFMNWKSQPIPFGQWPLLDETALDGENLAAAWNNRLLSQSLSVKAGVPVTITFFAKAALPPGMERNFPLGKNTPAHKAAKKIRRGVNFGNRWEVEPPFSWQISYSVEDIDRAVSEGFDHIRLPIAWHHHISRKNGVIAISQKLLSEIDPIINRALEKKMHVIIDWHHYDELTTDPDRYQQRFVNGWKAIATRFKDYPDALWFELINEPKDALNTERLNILQAHAIEAIRRICPERTLLVTSGKWGSILELPKLRLPADDNRLIVTVHNYDPFHFTHQGASWTKLADLKGILYPGPPEVPITVPESMNSDQSIISFIKDYNTLPSDRNPSSVAPIRNILDIASKWSEKNGRPIHLGEFGSISNADSASRARYTGDVRTLAEEKDIPWTLWDWKAGFAYWDEKTEIPLLRDAIFGN